MIRNDCFMIKEYLFSPFSDQIRVKLQFAKILLFNIMFEEDDIDLDFDENDKNLFEHESNKPLFNTLEDRPKSPSKSKVPPSLKINDPVTHFSSERKNFQPQDSNSIPSINCANSKEDRRKTCDQGNIGKNTKRKFPGPAGIVTLKPVAGDKRLVPDSDDDKIKDRSAEAMATDDSFGIEELHKCGVWKKAVNDIRQVLDQDVLKYSTEHIQIQSSVIVPYFLCKIVKIETSSRDPVVTLADNHGIIEGTFHREILDIHGRDIKSNNVLFLAKVAVLKTFKSKYLNITSNNILTIYSGQKAVYVKEFSKQSLSNFESEVKIRSRTIVSDIVNPLLNNFVKPNLMKPAPVPSSTSKPSPQALSSYRNNYSEVSNFSVSPSPSVSCSQTRENFKANPLSSKFKFKSTSASAMDKSNKIQSLSEARATFSSVLSENREKEEVKKPMDTPAASQYLVASLLSDLDSSDIWADF